MVLVPRYTPKNCIFLPVVICPHFGNHWSKIRTVLLKLPRYGASSGTVRGLGHVSSSIFNTETRKNSNFITICSVCCAVIIMHLYLFFADPLPIKKFPASTCHLCIFKCSQTSVFERLAVRTNRFSNETYEMEMTLFWNNSDAWLLRPNSNIFESTAVLDTFRCCIVLFFFNFISLAISHGAKKS